MRQFMTGVQGKIFVVLTKRRGRYNRNINLVDISVLSRDLIENTEKFDKNTTIQQKWKDSVHCC